MAAARSHQIHLKKQPNAFKSCFAFDSICLWVDRNVLTLESRMKLKLNYSEHSAKSFSNSISGLKSI